MGKQTAVSDPQAAGEPRIARARVKICGITREQDAKAAIDAGVDALGFVFYPPSPRAITTKRGAQLCNHLPPFVDKVALFVNANSAEIRAVLASVPISLIQFHGDESAEFCEQFELPYIKALRIKSGIKSVTSASDGDGSDTCPDGEMNHSPQMAVKHMLLHQNAAGFLLDAYHKGVPGGTGKTFDWESIPASDRPLILAGGLMPENVTEALTKVVPYAVDVSSGVESAPGIKDAEKIRRFMQAVGR